MPNPGSYTFFGNLVVSWSFNASKDELTVGATLNAKSIGNDLLFPGHNTAQFSGYDGPQQSTVNLTANFNNNTLTMYATESDPARSGTHTSNF
jgi:hypothetical protein